MGQETGPVVTTEPVMELVGITGPGTEQVVTTGPETGPVVTTEPVMEPVTGQEKMVHQ